MKQTQAPLDRFASSPLRPQSAAAICSRTYAKLEWLVPGIIPLEGVSMVVAPPKAGKSIFLLNVAISNTAGTPILEHFPPQRILNITYLDLESSDRRVEGRISHMTDNPPTNLTMVFKHPRLDTDGRTVLKDYLDHNPVDVLIVDILAAIQTERKISNTHNYNLDQQEISWFTDLSKTYGIAVVLVHHTRKTKSESWVDMVLGTHGISGTVDTILYLHRQEGQRDATLHVTGRDVEEENYIMRFNTTTFRWKLIGRQSDDLSGLSQSKQEVVSLLDCYDEMMTPTDIARHLDKSTSYIKKLLANLVVDGYVLRGERGEYTGRIRT